MDDAGLVRRFERVGDLTRDRDGFFERDGALSNALGERGSFDELEDGRVLLGAVDGSNVRLSEASTCASRRNLARRSVSAAKSSGKTLIATSRPSVVSRAR